MAGIFISYRRSDSDVAAGRLADDLADIFGRETIFRDVDTLEIGEDYENALDGALGRCAVLIAVIGPRWSALTDSAGRRRLDDPQDWVRIEIGRAIARGIRVVPTLISAPMPSEAELPDELKPLLKRQALELSDRNWRQGMEALARALEKIPGIVRPPAPRPVPPVRRNVIIAVLSIVVAGMLGWVGWEHRSAFQPSLPIDLSQWVRIRDSGPEGAVAGLAVVTAMEASLARQGRPVTLSARYLYEKAKRVDQYGPTTEGTDMSAALYIAERFGAPPEDQWPYIAGSRDLPKGDTWEKMDGSAARFRARTFRLSDVEDIPQQLAQGRTIVAQVEFTSGWQSEEAFESGYVRLGEKEFAQGNHVIVIVGFTPSNSSIKFANSWGVTWGANGFGWISLKDAQHAVQDMWAIEVPPP